MLVALATDLIAASQNTIVVWNNRLGTFPLIGAKVVSTESAADERALLARYSHEVDWTIIIAPETGGLLADRCRWIKSADGRLLGCAPSLVDLLSDKNRTAEHLAASGIPAPRGQTWRPGELPPEIPCPVVVKPCDGAGAQQTFLVESTSRLHELMTNYESPARIEEFVPGVACSVSFLCGPRDRFPLLPTLQRIEFGRHSHEAKTASHLRKIDYLGGRVPLPVDLAARATRLSCRAVRTLSEPVGYIGVDLVLGDQDNGSRDFVIEINPRFTTSYVGLRAASRSNLAQAMLGVAEGRRPSLSFNDEPIEFDANGKVRPGRSNSEP
jgi:tyramine---L-glutamate ligase